MVTLGRCVYLFLRNIVFGAVMQTYRICFPIFFQRKPLNVNEALDKLEDQDGGEDMFSE